MKFNKASDGPALGQVFWSFFSGLRSRMSARPLGIHGFCLNPLVINTFKESSFLHEVIKLCHSFLCWIALHIFWKWRRSSE